MVNRLTKEPSFLVPPPRGHLVALAAVEVVDVVAVVGDVSVAIEAEVK